MGSMGSPQPLNGAIRPPPRFKQQMDTLLLVGRVERCVVGPTRSTRIREHQDAFAPLHEGRGLRLAGTNRTGFQLLSATLDCYEPLGPSRDFSNRVGPKMLEQSAVSYTHLTLPTKRIV